jgi:prepilin-type processing-associated H-X9-DG protein
LFPVFAQAREKARQTACLSNEKQIATAFQMYVSDYDETMPLMVAKSGRDIYGVAGNRNSHWTAMLLEPYFKTWGIWNCPSIGPNRNMFNAGDPLAWYYNQMRFAAVGYNYSYLSQWDGNCADSKGISLAAVQKPAETVAFTDSSFDLGTNKGIGYAHVNAPDSVKWYPAPDVCVWSNAWEWPSNSDKPTNLGSVSPRHNEGVNVAFVDGHAKFYKVNALAAGTNFARGTGGEAVRVTDASKYLWDLE